MLDPIYYNFQGSTDFSKIQYGKKETLKNYVIDLKFKKDLKINEPQAGLETEPLKNNRSRTVIAGSPTEKTKKHTNLNNTRNL